MLSSLKFVQGSLSRKDLVPELSHFKIKGGFIKGFNGHIGLCSPIDLDLDVTPNGSQFVKAVQTCKETIGLHVTKSGKLSIKSGKFKALVECLTDKDFPEILPEGEFVKLDGKLLGALKKLAPFVADDASKAWARGILFKGESAYATNNVVLVETWLGYKFPMTVNIPNSAIQELIRIGEEPISLQITENRITFHFEGERWLTSQTYSTEWPDLGRILSNPCNPIAFPEGLDNAVTDIKAFTDKFGKVFFGEGFISTSNNSEEGASFEVASINFAGCYNAAYLLSICEIAKTIDFSQYPSPCNFFGENIRGAIIGMRQ